MKKYEIEFTKTLEGKFVIEAENEEQAWDLAETASIPEDCITTEDVTILDVTEL